MAWANSYLQFTKAKQLYCGPLVLTNAQLFEALSGLLSRSIPNASQLKMGNALLLSLQDAYPLPVEFSDRGSGHNSPPRLATGRRAARRRLPHPPSVPSRSTRSASSGSARCSFKASGAGADIHISISSWFGQNDGHGLRVNPPQRSVLGLRHQEAEKVIRRFGSVSV